jgi:hypothetical protein
MDEKYDEIANDREGDDLPPGMLAVANVGGMEIVPPIVMKTVDIELRDRLDEVEHAINDMKVEKEMVLARLDEAEQERRKLHRLVAVLNRMDKAELKGMP